MSMLDKYPNKSKFDLQTYYMAKSNTKNTYIRSNLVTYILLVLGATVLMYALIHTALSAFPLYAKEKADTSDRFIRTLSASGVKDTSAILNAMIVKGKGDKHSVHGFQYGETTDYGSVVSEIGKYSVGTYEMNVTGLTCGTTYHFRAFTAESAKKNADRRFGAGETFTTVGCRTPDIVAGRYGVTSFGFIYAEVGNIEVRFSPLGNSGEGSVVYVLEGFTYDPTSNTQHPALPSDIQNVTTWQDTTTVGEVHDFTLNQGAVVRVTSMGQGE